MNRILDCTGCACPEPVVRTRDYLLKNAGQEFFVIVDNLPAKENVLRFLQARNVETHFSEKDGRWTIAAAGQGGDCGAGLIGVNLRAAGDSSKPQPIVAEKKIVVLLTSDLLGVGDEELGKKLLLAFLKTLPEMGQELWRIVLLNSAVRLATDENAALPFLQKLAENGVSVLVCGTCLEFYNILEQKSVGETTNMLDVVTSLQLASSVIRP